MDKLSIKSRTSGHQSKHVSDVGLHNLTKKLKRKKTKTLSQKMKNDVKDPNHLTNDVKNKVIFPMTLANESKKKKSNKNLKEPKLLANKPLLDDFFGSKDFCDHDSDESDAGNFADADFFSKRDTLLPEDCDIECGPLMYSPTLVESSDPLPKKEQSLSNIVKIKKKKKNPVTLENKWIGSQQESLKKSLPVGLPKQVQPVKFYEISNKKFLVVVKHPTTLFFQGQLNVKVIFGSLEILGCTITSARPKSLAVFSPGGSSLLGLHALQHSDSQHNVENSLNEFCVDPKLANFIAKDLHKEHSIFVVDKVHTTLSTYLASQCSIYLYPRIIDRTRQFYAEENELQCKFDSRRDKLPKCFSKTQAWDDLACKIILDTAESQYSTDPPRVMICGGKSMGKSTLLRYLINKNLSKVNEVLVLDFDPGQAEFTVPGCLSVVRVTEPLLGPNFTHLLPAERMVYIGGVDVSKCPDRYIQSAQHIINYCQSQPKYKKMLWFINTMGFNKGLGVELTASLIQMVNPTHVVQIQSRLAKRNFPELLTPDIVGKHQNRWSSAPGCDGLQLAYSHVVLESAAENMQDGEQAAWGMEAKIARDIVVLSYINQMLQPPRYSLTDIVPFKVAFSRLKLSVYEPVHYSQFLNVINANLVALCSIGDDDENILRPNDSTLPCVLAQPPIAHCLGFGIVRGVDVPERVVYLLTPLAEQDLSSVDCLVMGSAMLPPCVYTGGASGEGHVPYVAQGPGQATSKHLGKRYIPPPKDTDRDTVSLSTCV